MSGTYVFEDPFNTVLQRVISHAAASGLFGKVQGAEPKSAPITGRSPDIFCAVWLQRVRPAMRSGSNSTSAVLEVMVRLYTKMTTDPIEQIDPNMLGAAHRLMGSYVGDFELGANARCVDIRGMEGTQMTAEAGYAELDTVMFRIVDITVPVIINDTWPETA